MEPYSEKREQRIADVAFLRALVAREVNANLKLGLLRAVNELEASPLVAELEEPAPVGTEPEDLEEVEE